MNTPLRRVSIAMMIMIVLLMANDLYVQVIKANAYAENQHNKRTVLNEYNEQRGLILASNGQTLASSQPTNDAYKYLRTYSAGPVYGPVTGYYSLNYGSGGMERAEDSVLNGSDDRLFVRRLSDLITGRDPRGGDVELTIDPKIQQAAYDAMVHSGFTGAAVAIRPSTGEILAMVDTPSFDPNPLASHDTATQQKAWVDYNTSAVKGPVPLLNQPVSASYQPGSTFKLVVATAALQNGVDDENTTNLPADPKITLPGTTATLSNFGGETCPGGVGGKVSMKSALAHSCNTAFATLAGEVGAPALSAQAAKFGFGQSMQIPLTAIASCVGPSIGGNCMNIQNGTPGLYQSGIGQQSVQETPLQNALVAATIANGGTEMQPQLVKSILAPDLSTVEGFTPQVMNSDVMSDQTAATLKDMMLASEQNSGTLNKDPKIQIASKTGTAEHGVDPKNTQPYGWYVAFAPDNDIAVAVVVTSGGSHSAQTIGAEVAAPVARIMINTSVGGG